MDFHTASAPLAWHGAKLFRPSASNGQATPVTQSTFQQHQQRAIAALRGAHDQPFRPPRRLDRYHFDGGCRGLDLGAVLAGGEGGGRVSEFVDWPEDDPMAKAERLLRQFRDALGVAPLNSDWLAEYRKYLDGKLIRAEVDGWPSPEAFSQFNARKFIRETLDSRQAETAAEGLHVER
jgi:hypothetical protein